MRGSRETARKFDRSVNKRILEHGFLRLTSFSVCVRVHCACAYSVQP